MAPGAAAEVARPHRRVHLCAGSRWLVIPFLIGVVAWTEGCATMRSIGHRLEGRGDRPKTQYRVVTPPIAYEMMRDSPGVLILDLRRPEEFQSGTGHLRGATNIPLARLPYRLLEIRSYRGETFLVYCDSQACGDAGMQVLRASGFDDAVLIDRGIEGWIHGGYGTFARAGTSAQYKLPNNPHLIPERMKPRGGEMPVVPPGSGQERPQPLPPAAPSQAPPGEAPPSQPPPGPPNALRN